MPRDHRGRPGRVGEVRAARASSDGSLLTVGGRRNHRPAPSLVRPPWSQPDLGGLGTHHPRAPAATTLCYHFGMFDRALRTAGLDPESPPPPRRVSWDQLDMVNALHESSRRHGHPPAGVDWLRASTEHPSTTTVPRTLRQLGCRARRRRPVRILIVRSNVGETRSPVPITYSRSLCAGGSTSPAGLAASPVRRRRGTLRP